MHRRARSLVAALPIFILSIACEDVTEREDRRALMAVDRGFSEKVATEGFRVMEDFYDEDAVYMPSFAPSVEGRDKILDFYRPYYDSKAMKLAWTPSRAEVSRSRDLGWTIGTYEFTRTDDLGATVVRRGRYVTIWKKQSDGSWKAVLDSGSPDEHLVAPESERAAPSQAAPAAPPAGSGVKPGGSGTADRP
jgi:ketosteroid isomerase-like protein